MDWLCSIDCTDLRTCDCRVQCASREQFCVMSNLAVSESLGFATTTLIVGSLLPSNKPAAAAVSHSGLNDAETAESECRSDESVIVEGVSFTVVILIAFSAFAIGVLLMSSLWFIYVKTSELFCVLLSQNAGFLHQP